MKKHSNKSLSTGVTMDTTHVSAGNRMASKSTQQPRKRFPRRGVVTASSNGQKLSRGLAGGLQAKKKQEKKERIILQSSQSFIHIKDIRRGVIITNDERYVKIVEFSPINFLLRSPIEQTSIVDSFASMLKISPCKIQFKSFSKKADTEKFLSILRRDYQNETNESVRELQREYMNLVSSVAHAEGVSRRFFMVIQYEPYVKSNDFNYISDTLNNTANAICNYMKQCGNEVIAYSEDLQDDDIKQLEILYELLNRGRAEFVSFANHYPQVVKRYIDYTGRSYSDPPFIPVTEFFAPKSIDINNGKYIIIDGKYYAYAYIPKGSYNDSVYAGWLSFLVNAGEGIDVDVFLDKVPKERAQSTIARHIRQKRVALKDTDDTNSDFDVLKDSIQSGFYLKEGLANNEDLYYMNVMVTIVGNDPDELEWKFKELNRILVSYDMSIKLCRWQMEQAFLSTLPLCRLDKNLQNKGKRNVLTSTAASTYIFSSYEMCDEDGVLFGINKSNRSLAVVDIFNTAKYKNANLAILGTSGAGKTFLMQCVATRMRLKGIQVFIIPPLKGVEFKRACDGIGGQYVNIAPGSMHCINIMDIRPIDDEASKLIDGDNVVNSRLAAKAQQVGIFLSLLDTEMSNEEKQLIDEAIIRVYTEYGITNDNESLIDPESTTGRFKTMPRLGDLHRVLKGNPKTERTANILNLLVSGSASNFNGQTNVDLDNKYVVLDISNLPKSLLTVGMFIVLDYVWDKIKEDRTARKAVFLDELWQLIGASSNPMAAEFVLEVFKIIRGYGGAAIAATQDLNDFFALADGKYGKGIINNAKTKIVLNLEKEEAIRVKEVIGLTQSETMAIMKFERGNGLVATNSNNVFIDFKAGMRETELITTDRILLERMVKKMSKDKNNTEVMTTKTET